ncbi:MAG: CcmD family protein [Bacteroides sp.]|nr:CcmD family protein [Bacteroides sp.]
MNPTDDKMIVVVLVISIILLGIAAFLFYLERKLDKVEKRLRDLEQERNTKQ